MLRSSPSCARPAPAAGGTRAALLLAPISASPAAAEGFRGRTRAAGSGVSYRGAHAPRARLAWPPHGLRRGESAGAVGRASSVGAPVRGSGRGCRGCQAVSRPRWRVGALSAGWGVVCVRGVCTRLLPPARQPRRAPGRAGFPAASVPSAPASTASLCRGLRLAVVGVRNHRVLQRPSAGPMRVGWLLGIVSSLQGGLFFLLVFLSMVSQLNTRKDS